MNMFGLASRLFGQDPKLEFRKPGAGVNLLSGPPIAPNDPYWAQYWLLFDSPTDVYTLLDSPSLNLVLLRSPENLHTLISVLSSHLFYLLSLPDFPKVTAGRNGAGGAKDGVDLGKEALNCLRVLGRVVPFVAKEGLEDPIFWRGDRVRVERGGKNTKRNPEMGQEAEVNNEAGQFVIEDDDEDDGNEGGGMTPTPKKDGSSGDRREDEEEWEETQPLAPRLLAALVALAFVPGFTVPEECRTGDGAVSYVIWEPGIATQPTSQPTTSQMFLSNRLEILRFLTVLLSLPSLLTPSHLFPHTPNRWRDTLVASSTLERKAVLCLLCSILNTAFQPTRPAALSEKLGGVLRREDVKGLLVGTCLQVLGVLFSEHAEPAAAGGSRGGEGPSMNGVGSPFVDPSATMGGGGGGGLNSSTSSATSAVPSGNSTSGPVEPNAFAFYLSKLHRTSDFEFIVSGVLNLLSLAVATPLIPGGPRGGWATEALLVLWRVMELNGKCVKWMVEKEKVGELCVLLTTVCLEFKDDEVHMGLVRLAAFMLQTVVAEPGLEKQLNSSAEAKLHPTDKGKFNVPSSVADFIIVSIYTLIFTTKARLASLYPAFVLTIDNMSPYLKNLSVLASSRVMQLFMAFSAPSFLLMEEGNPRLVYYMLETLNNIIHYQLNTNPNLVYSVIRSHKRFEELSTFSLASGVAEVRRQRAEKKAAASAAKAPPVSPRSASPNAPAAVPMKTIVRKEHEDQEKDGEEEGTESVRQNGGGEAAAEVSEKARGKMREGSVSVAALSLGDLSLDSSQDDEVFVGKHGFIPTESWVASWREGLPLDSILIVLAELRPQLFDLSTSADSNEGAIAFLSSASLAGHLPDPPALRPRRFIFNPQSITWFASLLYGSIYLGSLDVLRDVPVQLFAVAQARRGASATDLVSGAAAFVMSKVGQAGGGGGGTSGGGAGMARGGGVV